VVSGAPHAGVVNALTAIALIGRSVRIVGNPVVGFVKRFLRTPAGGYLSGIAAICNSRPHGSLQQCQENRC